MAEEKEKKAPKKDAAAAAPKKDAKKADAKAEKPTGPAEVLPADYVPRLRKHYDEVVKPELIKKFGYKNVMEVPRLEKIVLNMGIGEATQDSASESAAVATAPAAAARGDI